MSVTASSTYVRLYDDFAEHPKALVLGDRAFRVYISALCYSSRNTTNGHVPRAVLAALRGTPKHAAELVAAGLWEVAPAGWTIHDYLLYQRSRQQIDKERDAARDRMQRLRNGSVDVRANIDKRSGEVRKSSGEVRDPEVRGQRSEVDHSPSPSAGAREKAADWYEHVTGRLIGPDKALRQVLDDVDFVHGAECVGWAFEQGIGKNEPWMYVKRILDSCGGLKNEGHGPREKEQRHGRKPVRASAARSATDSGGRVGGLGAPGVDPAFAKYADRA